MGVDGVVVEPVALVVGQALEVDLADRHNGVAGLLVDRVAVDVEGVGERVVVALGLELAERGRDDVGVDDPHTGDVVGGCAQDRLVLGVGRRRGVSGGAQALVAPAPVEPAVEAPVRKHAEKQKVENAYFFRIDGKDSQGQSATFDFIMLTNEFTWVKGSTSQVISGDKVIPEAEAAHRVLSQQVRDSLASASDLIAVGLASSEGERTQEEARALDRAKTVSHWMSKVSKPEMALWTLTLGQYDKACKEQEDMDSSFERPVIFAGVRSKADGANLQEALADAISGHDNLPSRGCYSRFDLEKTR